jgi:hypothetical protein
VTLWWDLCFEYRHLSMASACSHGHYFWVWVRVQLLLGCWWWWYLLLLLLLQNLHSRRHVRRNTWWRTYCSNRWRITWKWLVEETFLDVMLICLEGDII